jgi:PhzF family phenazine biosynthesis protein
MGLLRFSQVNVFASEPFSGNPLAVIHGADDLSDRQMAEIARWTNLSETVFLQQPTTPESDYKVRIFSPQVELPFAGHPTLGSCYAWLSAGGSPAKADYVVQECGAGLVTVRKNGARLEFSAPPLIRTGPIGDTDLIQISSALGISRADILHHQWVDNGPGWCAIMVSSAEKVLSLEPDWAALAPLNLGVVGLHESGGDATVEVRSFIGDGGYEDPVTGSLNASLAQWLLAAGLVEAPYVAAQGTMLQRAGRVYLHESENEVWVGGDVVSVITGDISI